MKHAERKQLHYQRVPHSLTGLMMPEGFANDPLLVLLHNEYTHLAADLADKETAVLRRMNELYDECDHPQESIKDDFMGGSICGKCGRHW